MSRHRLILPQADAACGKIFFPDRRTADGHRIGLEVWNRATGRGREGYRLTVHRCKRCGGYHVSQRPVDRLPVRPLPIPSPDADRDESGVADDWDYEIPRVRRIAQSSAAWF